MGTLELSALGDVGEKSESVLLGDLILDGLEVGGAVVRDLLEPGHEVLNGAALKRS